MAQRKGTKIPLVLLVTDERMIDPTLVSELTEAGLHVELRATSLGVITGTVGDERVIDTLKHIAGVERVELDRRYQATRGASLR